MPPPANADELLVLIQRSGVADEAKLRSYLQKLSESSGIPSDPQKFAGMLVRDGILTYFQAEQLLQGKYKRFTIGKYKVLEKLGAGGMAQVFLCEHKLMRRRVAIKVLPTAKAEDPSSLERFYREARAVAAVDHPNIVRAYDIDQDENLHFLVMEYVDGTNLQDLVKKVGPLDPLRACHYIYGAAVGLQHAHEMGLVHRDIKPGNILVDRSGVVKILDMGLARFFHDEEDILTKKYDENVLGTADYLAPEQALESHSVDIRADIYSLGATFYYLLTGSPLFPEGSVAQKLIWHQTREPRPIRELRPEVPEEIVAIVNKMMAKDREKRYQTPAEVMAALAPWVATPIPPPADHEMPQLSPAAGGVPVRSSSGPATSSFVTPALTSAQPRPSSPASPLPGLLGHPPTTPLPRPARPTTLPRPEAQPGGGGGGVAPSVPGPPAPPPGPLAPGAEPVGSPLVPVVSPSLPVVSPSLPAMSPSLPDAAPALWESLATTPDETQRVAQADTAPNTRVPRARPVAPGRRRRPSPVVIAGSLLAVVGITVGLYYAFFAPSRSAPLPSSVVTAPSTLVVADDGDGNRVATLREALNRVPPGGVITVAKSRLVETGLKLDRVRHKNVTIRGETADGSPPVIEPNAGVATLLDISSVEGVRLQNLELDCGGRADVGLLVSGVCPDLHVEQVTVRGAKTAGIRFINAAGAKDRPIVLDRVRLILDGANQSGVLLTAVNVDTRLVTVQSSRFEGPSGGSRTGVGVRVEGPTSELAITGNRFHALDSAVWLGHTSPQRVTSGQIVSNTVVGCTVGLRFDMTPQPNASPGRFELTVAQNYFARTGKVGQFSGPAPPAGLSPVANGQGPGCHPGNVPLALTDVGAPPPPTDPNDDGTFLRFPGGPPEVGGKKVGAP